MGPPKSVAFDSGGNATRAAMAFAQKHGVAVSRLKTIQTPKGEYLSVVRREKGESAQKILQHLIPEAISKIQFPKTMYWSQDKFRFARPLSWVVALYQGRVIKFRVADVASSNYTVGHRAIGKSKIGVTSLASLKSLMRKNGVIVDPAERASRIVDGLKLAAKKGGGQIVDDPELLQLVVNLNEYPCVISGAFDPRFLELPKEILITVMREQQKYFSLTDSTGRLLPIFAAVINLDADRKQEIRKGHERVLRARLGDAAFFWETDRRKKLAEREESLRHVLFQEKLGSYYDKTQRLTALLPQVTEHVGCRDLAPELEVACHLSKCDLVTEMVKEFTDLQGIVGGLYARAESYPEGVWRAIYEQYLPKSTNSPSPSTRGASILALVDRLDTICGCFTIGLVPTGSGDPFALRRQGNGILKIILDHRFSVSLEQLMDRSLRLFRIVSAETALELKKFFEGRLRFLLEELGYSYDCINAGLSIGFDDPLDALERVRALEEMRKEADFLALASNFKRVKNILVQAGNVDGEPNLSMMDEPAEKSLWQNYLEVRPTVEEARRNHDYARALRAMASMRQAVDRFFDEVLVMTDQLELRRNRLSILDRLVQLFLTVADISEIVVEQIR